MNRLGIIRLAVVAVLILAPAGGLAEELPPLHLQVTPGVPEPLAGQVRELARSAWEFVTDDLGVSGENRKLVEVVLAADHEAMRGAAQARGHRLKATSRVPGVTSGSVIYLDAHNLLATRSGRARSPDNARFTLVRVLAHELVHVISTRVGRRNTPRWFSEGLAVHEAIRFARLVPGLADEARRFEGVRLAPAVRDGPMVLSDLGFGKKARALFYGPEHRRCYSTGYVAVRAIVDRHTQAALGRLLAAAGWGLSRATNPAERSMRWERAFRSVLGPGTDLDAQVRAWISRARSRAPGAEDDEEPPDAEEEPPPGEEGT